MGRGQNAALAEAPTTREQKQIKETWPAAEKLYTAFTETVGIPSVSKVIFWDEDCDPHNWNNGDKGIFASFNWNDKGVKFSPSYSQLLKRMAAGQTTAEENFAITHVFTHELFHACSGNREPQWAEDQSVIDSVTDQNSLAFCIEEGIVESLARINAQQIASKAGFKATPAFLTHGTTADPIYIKTGAYPYQTQLMLSLAHLINGELDLGKVRDQSYGDIENMNCSPEVQYQLLSWLSLPPSRREMPIRGHIGIATGKKGAEAASALHHIHKELTSSTDYKWVLTPKKLRKNKYNYQRPRKDFGEMLAETLDPFVQ